MLLNAFNSALYASVSFPPGHIEDLLKRAHDRVRQITVRADQPDAPVIIVYDGFEEDYGDSFIAVSSALRAERIPYPGPAAFRSLR